MQKVKTYVEPVNKQRLKDTKKQDKITCLNCDNQTFILPKHRDFPFFDAVCSKCGCIEVK